MKDPGPEPNLYLVLTDPNLGGPKTYGSPATLLQQEGRDLHSANYDTREAGWGSAAGR